MTRINKYGQENSKVNLNSRMLKHPHQTIEGEKKEQVSRWNWPDPLKSTKTVRIRREGGRKEEELSLLTLDSTWRLVIEE